MRLYRRDKPEESCESGIRGRKVQKNHADNSAIPSPGAVVIFSRNGLNLQYSSGKAEHSKTAFPEKKSKSKNSGKIAGSGFAIYPGPVSQNRKKRLQDILDLNSCYKRVSNTKNSGKDTSKGLFCHFKS